ATDPCGEQPMQPYRGSRVGSISLSRLLPDSCGKDATIDLAAVDDWMRVAVMVMNNTVDASRFPLPEQEAEARAKRRIGLGVTGLADALLMVGLRYGSEEAAQQTEDWMRGIARAAYRASVELAGEKGAFPLFEAEKYLATGNMMQMDEDVRAA